MKHKIKKTIQDSRFRIQDGGFTIIEMVIVVAIIGLLSSVVLTGLNKSRQKARDVRRISHILQIQHELETYRIGDENNEYPFSDALNPIGAYLSDLPLDPLTGKDYEYQGDGNIYIFGACLEQPRPASIDNFSDYPFSGEINNLDNCCDCCDNNVYCVSRRL